MTRKIVTAAGAVLLIAALTGCSGEAPAVSSAESSEVTSAIQSQVTEAASASSSSAVTESTAPSPVPGDSVFPALDEIRQGIVTTARSLAGIPFAMGKASPEAGFDNSGLIYYVLRENGYINCPRSTTSQLIMGSRTDKALPGDVIFFSDEADGETIYFAGIYLGDDTIIYSPYPGEVVKTADIKSTYWQDKMYCIISVE